MTLRCSLDFPADLRDLRILFVEDDDDLRELGADALRLSGAEVSEARSLDEALSLLRSFRPDVLVSDLGLAHEDGIDLIRRIRALPEASGGRVPAIALTGRAAIGDSHAALRAGFQVHVAKPVNLEFLTQAVANVVGLTVEAPGSRLARSPHPPDPLGSRLHAEE
jgi:CheY-like chemotaxis protein